ncbi:EthD domain-containing protein [Rhizobium sp. FKL33]|uniref:EthD domain-containing protein n=1 Tax=Rhizobium sp. FKL33 TaxID=2562307 RepID=UPI0010C0540C|nr:EthD domain-containing protein [Rhizobium sp. FKL33]
MTIKLMMFGRRSPGQTLVEHRRHMKDVHGRIVLDYIAADPQNAPRKYVQNHGLDAVFAGDDAAPAALRLGLDFVTQIWFEDLGSLKASRETAFYNERLRPDEPRFVDNANVIGQPFSEERVREPASASTDVKVFVVRPAGQPAVDVAERLAASDVAYSGHCRNTAVTPGPIAAVDEFWTDGEDEARRLLDHCRAALNAHATEAERSAAFLIAREYRLFAGR